MTQSIDATKRPGGANNGILIRGAYETAGFAVYNEPGRYDYT
jgi:hypothetical protein